MRLVIATQSEEQTVELGEAIGLLLAPGDVVALHGELGAGKTRVVRGMARALGADPARVSSPTFVIMQEYRCGSGRPIDTLVHVDAYRLRGADELETVGWDRVSRDLEHHAPLAVAVEWAERIDASLPRGPGRMDVRLEHAPGDSRRVTIECDDAWTMRPACDRLARFAEQRERVRPATTCPVTGKPVPPDSPTYPFFDEKARMADLGRWLSGSYSISREVSPDEEPPQ